MSPETTPAKPASELREITDARTLRALTHPVRIALIETLTLQGAMTATEAAEQIGESPTTCSFHLRQLAKYGFVEEAGGGKGRARPWRMTSIGMSFSSVHDDTETQLAAGALVRLIRERQLDRYRTWLETRRSYPKRWQKAAVDSEWALYLTVDELEQLEREVSELLLPRFRERLTDPSTRPAGAAPVELLLFAYPVAPPAEDYPVAPPAEDYPVAPPAED
jgi:DNA-binding transcriptional ArsR family regulator